MELPPAVGLLIVLVLVLANGFFVATEFGIVAVRKSRLEQLAQEGSRAARAAQDVVQHLDAYIAACQFGITIASLALGWIGEPVLAHLLEPTMTIVLRSWAPAAAHGLAVGIAFSVITALHIVAGELAPKGMALQRPDITALWVAYPIRAFYRLFRWPISGLNAIGNGSLRLLGFHAASAHENVHSAEELRYLVEASRDAGTVEESEARIAHRAFRFADLSAGELMTPRRDVEAVPVDITLPDLISRVRSVVHSRLPVFEDSPDDIVGILNVRDLVGLVPDAPDFDLRLRLEPAHVVPRMRRADELLEDMRQGGFSLAIVVDEFGVMAGVVTFHDLMEGLVGRIENRGDKELIGPVLPDGSRLIDGLARLAELQDATGIRVTDEDRSQADTLSGVVMLRLGNVPAPGHSLEIDGRRLTVESVTPHRIPILRLHPREDGAR